MASPEQTGSAAGSPQATPVLEQMDFDGPGSPTAQPAGPTSPPVAQPASVSAPGTTAAQVPVSGSVPPPNPGGRAACSEATGLGVAKSHILLAVCQSVVCGTILKPRSALSSEKSRDAVCEYTIIDRVSFYVFIYRKSLSGLLDIRSFVTESALTANRK